MHLKKTQWVFTPLWQLARVLVDGSEAGALAQPHVPRLYFGNPARSMIATRRICVGLQPVDLIVRIGAKPCPTGMCFADAQFLPTEIKWYAVLS